MVKSNRVSKKSQFEFKTELDEYHETKHTSNILKYQRCASFCRLSDGQEMINTLSA